jgi:hypothetical protein
MSVLPITWEPNGQELSAEGQGYQARIFPAPTGGGWNGRIKFLPSGEEETAHYLARGDAIMVIERELAGKGLIPPVTNEE